MVIHEFAVQRFSDTDRADHATMRIYNSFGAGGVFTRRELTADGFSRRDIEQAEREGALQRVDRCRYATLEAVPDVVAAARADATLTCISALAVHGAWTMPTASVHVRRGDYGARRRELPANALLCNSPLAAALSPLDDIPAALCAAIRHHETEDAVLALDSLLHQRRLTRSELHVALAPAGHHGLRLLGKADARTESPLESIVRQRLRAAGLKPRVQVPIPEVGRVDFLVGTRLILEVDGRAYHDSGTRFDEDRRRDRVAVRLGYIVIRLTWTQVLFEWPDVIDDLLTIVRSRVHRR